MGIELRRDMQSEEQIHYLFMRENPRENHVLIRSNGGAVVILTLSNMLKEFIQQLQSIRHDLNPQHFSPSKLECLYMK